jgi:fumarate hydratase subunit beta
MNKKILKTPIDPNTISMMVTGSIYLLNGTVLCGRDAVIPRIVRDLREGTLPFDPSLLEGSVIFHTAVSVAGIGPTSSNKLEIEENMIPLSQAGVRIHLGKGKLHRDTTEALAQVGSVYAITPPVTAILTNKILQKRILAYPDLGMEALYMLEVRDFPLIIASANGKDLYK